MEKRSERKITVTYDDKVKEILVGLLGYKVHKLGYLLKNGQIVKDMFFNEDVRYDEIGGFLKEGVFKDDISSLLRYVDYIKKDN